MWPINTFGSGDVLSDVIRSIVFLMGGGYESLLRLGMLCLVFGGIVSFLGRGRIQWQWVFGAIIILAVTLNIRMTVLVHDLVNPGVPDQVIGNVPLAVAFPAYMVVRRLACRTPAAASRARNPAPPPALSISLRV